MLTWLSEQVRCARHNALHLKHFRIGYRRPNWWARYGSSEMAFPHYPYLAFHDIEGYLHGGSLVPRPGMTVLDAGGCYGEYALFAAKCVGPSGRVVMVEPDPANVQVARRVFELNGNPANIQIFVGGLWSRPGAVDFAAGHGAESSVVATSGAAADHAGTTSVPVHSLRSLVDAFGLQRLDLVKMDVEGAELEILPGVRDLPDGMRPSFAIASYHVVDGRRTADVIPSLLAAMGYSCSSGNPRHLTTWASHAGG